MALIASDGLGWFTTVGGASSAFPAIEGIDATGGRNGRQAIQAVTRVVTGTYPNIRLLPRTMEIREGRTIQFSFYTKYASLGYSRWHWALQTDTGSIALYLTETNGNMAFATSAGTITTPAGNTGWFAGAQTGVWYRYTIQWYNANSGGTFRVWRDGTLIVNYTGDTFKGNWNVTRFVFGNWTSGGQPVLWNDFLFLDDQGDGLNATTGDFGAYIINTYRPNADGDVTDYTPQGGGANYVEVDDADPDDETTYVSSGTNGQQDLFSMESIGNPRTIYAVKLGVNVAISPVSSESRIRGICKSGTTTEVGGEEAVTAESYELKEFEFPYDPDSASAEWDQTSVNAAQFGYESVID
jgi:hypothetical protein